MYDFILVVAVDTADTCGDGFAFFVRGAVLGTKDGSSEAGATDCGGDLLGTVDETSEVISDCGAYDCDG